MILVSTIISMSTSITVAQTKKQKTFTFDTGILTLGPNQMLRIVTNNNDPDEAYSATVKRMSYLVISEQDSVRYRLISQDTSGPILREAAEGFSIDVGTSEAVRVLISSTSPNLRTTVQLVDTTTGNIIAILIGL